MPKNRKKYKRDQSRPRLRGRNRRISIRSELRDVPDVQKIARAIVALAMAQAEKGAQAAAEADPSTVTHDTVTDTDAPSLPEVSS